MRRKTENSNSSYLIHINLLYSLSYHIHCTTRGIAKHYHMDTAIPAESRCSVSPETSEL